MKRRRTNPALAKREHDRQRRWRLANPVRIGAYQRKWQQEHPNLRGKRQKEYVARHRPQVRSYMNARRARLRQEFLAAYGSRCWCCGERQQEFLTIDHHGEAGKRLRAEHGRLGGAHLYELLKRQGWPQEGLRLLCMNCNWGFRFGAVCPHARQDPHGAFKLNIERLPG